MRSTREQLIRGVIRDLIADYLAAVRDGLADHAVCTLAELREIFTHRHSAECGLNAFGWPVVRRA